MKEVAILHSDRVNLLVAKVDSQLNAWTLPPSGVDWFNYGGIYRAVYLRTTRAAQIADYTLKTTLDGLVSISAILRGFSSAKEYHLVAKVVDHLGMLVAEGEITEELGHGESCETSIELVVEEPQLWGLGAAYLYHLQLELMGGDGNLCDQREQRFGVREFQIAGQKILLNGKEVKLVGCAKHDEYPLTGRATTREQLIKDYELLRQMNANFVRLAHYPHNRLEHEILDEMGMLAISEIPMVFLREAQMTSSIMLSKSKQMLAEMIQAEKNTTSIMFWSLFIECETHLATTREFVEEMVTYTKELDETRLVVMASDRPLSDVTYDLFDVIGINYWEGWYGGQSVSAGVEFLEKMAQRFPDKPFLITSHGWEGLYGERSYIEKVPWSEDLQADYLAQIADVYMSFKNIVGEIIWTFADFRVSNWRDISVANEHLTYLGRPSLVNHKGVVDFYRRPKSTYFAMRAKFDQWQEIVAPPVRIYDQNLQTKVFSNRQLAGEVAAFDFIDKVQALLKSKETINVIFASAGSQVEFLESLLRNRMLIDWRRINAFHLDEFAGAGPDTSYGFAHWLRKHIIEHLPFSRFEFLDGRAENLEAECHRYAALLRENEIDLACIGIGENGHLAFNDPPVADFEDPVLVKLVDLDETCREQQFREGLFPDLISVPQQALTLTIPAILRAKEILCVVPGSYKAMVVWKTLNAEISTQCPATILRRHASVNLYLDQESAGLL